MTEEKSEGRETERTLEIFGEKDITSKRTREVLGEQDNCETIIKKHCLISSKVEGDIHSGESRVTKRVGLIRRGSIRGGGEEGARKLTASAIY